MNAATPAVESLTSMPQTSARGLIIAASISSAILASGLSLAVQYLSSSWQDQRATRIAEVTKFVESAQQFDGLVTSFMGPFVKGSDTNPERQALRENIQTQYSLLETARTNLEPAQSNRAKEYEDSLVKVATELDRNKAAPDAHDLVQAISTTRGKNVCVVFDLRKKAGLPVIKSDESPCNESLAK